MNSTNQLEDSQTVASKNKNQQRRVMLYWVIAFALSQIASAASIRWLLPEGSFLVWPVAILPIAIAIPTIRSYLLLVRQMDELWRKIELESTALGFMTGFVFHFTVETLNNAGLPELWFNSTGAVLLLSKVVFQVVLARKYL